jgi:AGZA family xanthine/uracil permease-like MFS transporter
MRLDVRGALHLGLIEIVFVFLFVDLFDNVGTLLAVGKKARLFDSAEGVPRLDRILFSDAIATVAGSMAGTSTVVSYIESSAGVAAGGRSGVTAIVTGLLFAVALFVAPLAGAIPQSATAPALICVGSLMMTAAGEIAWADPEIAIPAFLTMMGIPLMFSIANGLAFGFTAFTLIKVLRGRFRQVSWMVYAMTALFILRFWYMGR